MMRIMMLQYHSNDRKISGEILPVLEEGMQESKDAIATKIHFYCWCFLQCRCRRLFRQLSTEFYQQKYKRLRCTITRLERRKQTAATATIGAWFCK
jgi:hypothetical protein